MNERACHLPGLDPKSLNWETLSFDRMGNDISIDVPILSASDIQILANHVRTHARRYLANSPVNRIVDVIDQAVDRLLDRDDPYRCRMEDLLPAISGYDREMFRLGLTEYLKTFRRPELLRFISEDFPNPAILDDFQPLAKGGYGRAFGPEVCAHIWAGNVPGLPLWSLVSGLLIKSGTIGKVPSAEPMFATWFVKLLTEIDPELGDCIAIVWWKGGNEALQTALFAEADVALAYGDNEVLSTIKSQVPVSTRFLAHGHKVSFGMVGREALDAAKATETARLAAYDVARYDQQGCYSPHVNFVETGGVISPRTFAQYFAQELAGLEGKFPRRPLGISEASSVAAWRHSEELASGAEVLGDVAGTWSVSYYEGQDGFRPSALNRTIRVVAIDDLTSVPDRVAPYKRLLQTVGIATSPRRLISLSKALGAVGVTRITALGKMSMPEAGWHHDGRYNLSDLVRIVEIEKQAFDVADRLAAYAD